MRKDDEKMIPPQTYFLVPFCACNYHVMGMTYRFDFQVPIAHLWCPPSQNSASNFVQRQTTPDDLHK